MKRFLKRRQVLIVLMVLLFASAAAIFLVVGVRINKVADEEIAKIVTTPTPPPSGPRKLSFARLELVGLQPSSVEVFVRDIPGSHGLGVYGDELFASSWDERAIYRVDLASGAKRLLADELGGAHDMVFDGQGNIITPLFQDNRVVRVDRRSGQVTPLAGGLGGPNGIAKARDGGYYVSNAQDGRVVKIGSAGQVSQIAGGLHEPAGILADNDNILIIAQFADSENAVLRRQDNGKVATVVRGLANAESLLRDEEQNIIIGHTVDGKAALSIFPRGKAARPLLVTNLPGPMVGPVTDGKYLYFESTAPGQSTIYRIALPQ